MAKDMITLLGLPADGPFMAALVGAGGKTTALLALAQEYKALNRSVLITTTTRIYLPPADFADAVFLDPQASRLPVQGAKGTITLIGEGVEANGKVVGVAAPWLDAVYGARLFDVILIEADGSRGKPVKAPGAHEPVIPGAVTHVIGIIGMDAWGQPANRDWVHRLEEFLRVTGAEAGQRIDALMLKSLIESPEGLFKSAPASAERILLLNKCSHGELTKAAEILVAQLDKSTFILGAWQ